MHVSSQPYYHSVMEHSAKAVKNLVGICLPFILTFGPYLGILSLQSSVNSEHDLGLISAVTLNTITALSLPIIPIIYTVFGSKYSLIIGQFLLLVYASCNYYPSWYTLVPGSIAMGIAINLIFISSLTHISETASLYASSLDKNYEHTVALFLGIFSASAKGGNGLVSTVSSFILFSLDYNYTTTLSISNESDQCQDMGASYIQTDYLYYLLISVYIGSAVIGIILAFILLDNFRPVDDKFKSVSVCFKKQVVAVARLIKLMFTNYKMLLLFPLFVLNGVAFGFISGSFTKVFIADCIGVEMIGFVIGAYGVVSLVMGLLFGYLRRLIPAFIFILMGILISAGLTLFLLFWSREPSYYAVFGFAVGWGICDAIWLSIVSGVIGFVFSETKNAAFTIYEFGISVGFIATFSFGILFSISVHLWLILTLILYSGISYTVLVLSMKYSERKQEKYESFEMKDLNRSTNDPTP